MFEHSKVPFEIPLSTYYDELSVLFGFEFRESDELGMFFGFL